MRLLARPASLAIDHDGLLALGAISGPTYTCLSHASPLTMVVTPPLAFRLEIAPKVQTMPLRPSCPLLRLSTRCRYCRYPVLCSGAAGPCPPAEDLRGACVPESFWYLRQLWCIPEGHGVPCPSTPFSSLPLQIGRVVCYSHIAPCHVRGMASDGRNPTSRVGFRPHWWHHYLDEVCRSSRAVASPACGVSHGWQCCSRGRGVSSRSHSTL